MIEIANAILLAFASAALLVGAVYHLLRRREPATSAFLAIVSIYLGRRAFYWLNEAFWEPPSIADNAWLTFFNAVALVGIIVMVIWERHNNNH